jgi:hypothetical protein
MVHSKLDDSINYSETKLLEKEDVSYDAPIYEYDVLGKTITIALGQSKYTFIDKDIIYYPVYIIKNDCVNTQIGVYEVIQSELSNYMDEDGDIDIVKLGEPLLYSFFNMNIINDVVESTSKKDKDNDGNSVDTKTDNTGDGSEIEYESEYESEDEDDIWVNYYMKGKDYNIIDNEGGGDCLFAAIRDGLRGVGKKITVEEMRKKLVQDPSIDRVYANYKNLFEMYQSQFQESNKKMKSMVKKNKLLQEQMQKSKDIKVQQQIIEEGEKVAKAHDLSKKEKSIIKDDFDQIKFMKGVDSLDAFKQLVQTCEFWGEAWSISTLERLLNIKLILLSEENYDEDDIENIIQCGEMDELLEKSGTFEPDYYIILSYTGNHYKLITYHKKTALLFNEMDDKLIKKLKNKCLEKNAGLYSIIPQFKKSSIHAEKMDLESKQQQGSLVDDKLYNDNTVFQFYSKSADKPLPGKGSGEKLGPEGVVAYSELKSIPKWRKKLSNFWPSEFTLDGKRWLSVEHYYQANKFKKGFPEFYNSFSLDSDSELSKNTTMAKSAGGKTGKYKGQLLRPKSVVMDGDFFEGNQHNKTMKDAMMAKFSQHEELKKLLLATKQAKLVHFQRGSPPVVFTELMEVRRTLRHT